MVPGEPPVEIATVTVWAAGNGSPVKASGNVTPVGFTETVGIAETSNETAIVFGVAPDDALTVNVVL
jgi:hypothetical protein